MARALDRRLELGVLRRRRRPRCRGRRACGRGAPRRPARSPSAGRSASPPRPRCRSRASRPCAAPARPGRRPRRPRRRRRAPSAPWSRNTVATSSGVSAPESAAVSDWSCSVRWRDDQLVLEELGAVERQPALAEDRPRGRERVLVEHARLEEADVDGAEHPAGRPQREAVRRAVAVPVHRVLGERVPLAQRLRTSRRRAACPRGSRRSPATRRAAGSSATSRASPRRSPRRPAAAPPRASRRGRRRPTRRRRARPSRR